ncbi:MAG: flagellar export chaperone FlgN [Caldilineaceae bacterium]
MRYAVAAHVEQLARILSDQQETCLQLAECASEQQEALRVGRGPDFVRSSLTQAHLARRFYFLEEERMAAVDSLARSLAEDAGPIDLALLLERLPAVDAQQLSARTEELRRTADKVREIQRVSAQMIQTNIQLAAALTRQVVDPSSHYYGAKPANDKLPASQLDQRI